MGGSRDGADAERTGTARLHRGRRHRRDDGGPLARPGRIQVTLFERNDHVGGKFGAVLGPTGAVHEHAYHFLGDWCVNFWGLVEEIGLSKEDDFRASLGVRFLRPIASKQPFAERLSTLRLNRLGKDLTGTLQGGMIPPDDLMIWFYSILDLITYGQDLDEKELLNRISVNGFMRSLPYMTDRPPCSTRKPWSRRSPSRATRPRRDRTASSRASSAAIWTGAS